MRARAAAFSAAKIFAAFIMSAAPVAIAEQLNWYRGNTHTHTSNSDGDSTPDVVARWYRENGYQFVFITDHEYLNDVVFLNAMLGRKDHFLVLSGQEITQWSEDSRQRAAHVNGLFMAEVVLPIGKRLCLPETCVWDGQAPASMSLGETFTRNVGAVLAQGAIAQVNHPNYMWSVRPEDLKDVPDGTLLEIWNGQARINNLGGDDGAGDVRLAAEGLWDDLLSRGRIVWGVAADDSHYFDSKPANDGALPGQAWIWVRAAELTPPAIEAALRTGNFFASNGVSLQSIVADGETLSLTIAERTPGVGRYVTRFFGQNGRVLAQVAGTRPSYRFTGTETYVRATITDSNGKHAWIQPVFRDKRSRTVRVPANAQ